VSRKPIWTFGKNKLKRSFKKEKYLWYRWVISKSGVFIPQFFQSVKLSPQICKISRTLNFVTDSRFTLNIDAGSQRSRVTSLSCCNLSLSNVELLWSLAQSILLHALHWVILRFFVSGFRTRLFFWTGIGQLSTGAFAQNMRHLSRLYLNQIRPWRELNLRYFMTHHFNQF
jgi:hypothetical protein